MIDMQLSSEQEQIVDTIGSFLADALGYARFVPQPTPVLNRDRDRFAALGELGVFGLGLDEERGGIGYTIVEEVLVARELGRFLVSPTAIATMIAVHVAAQAGEAALVEELRSGGRPVAAALAFHPAAAGGVGEHHLVDGDGCAWALLWTATGVGLLPAGDWRDRREVPSIDTSVLLERAQCGAEPAIWVPAEDGLARRAQLLVCAYLAGIAEASVHDSVEYAGVREQFQQPIGAFQALKHRCADMLARASVAWNLTVFATLIEAAGGADAEYQAIAAKLIAADSAFRNAAANIQNHGAFGFTGEHHAHLFVKRAHILDRMGGDITFQKSRMLAATAPSQEAA